MVPGVEVPGGDYRFHRAYALIASTTARPLSAFASVDFGGLYDGSSRDYGAGFEWRVNKHATLGTEVTLSQIDLPTGNADVVVGKTPIPPEGYEVARIDVVVRLRRKPR